jgi:hypothetical protein
MAIMAMTTSNPIKVKACRLSLCRLDNFILHLLQKDAGHTQLPGNTSHRLFGILEVTFYG